MKKKRSVERLMKNIFMLLLAVLVMLLIVLSFGNYRSLLRGLNETNIGNLTDYSSSFAMALDSFATSNKRITTNPYFDYLALGLSESDKVVPEYNLRQIMDYQTPYYGASLMYDSHDGSCYYVLGYLFHVGQSTVTEHSMMRQLCYDIGQMDTDDFNHWFFYEFEEQPFLVLINRNSGMYLCSILSLDTYVQNNPIPSGTGENGAFLFNQEKVLLSYPEPLEGSLPQGIIPQTLQMNASQIISDKFVGSVDLKDTDLGIGVVIPLSAIRSQILMQMLPFLFASLFGIASVLIAYVVCKSVLVFPLQEISTISQQIGADQQTEPVVNQKSEFVELDRICASLQDLIHQVRELEAEKRMKEFEKEQALLQYYQLQTKSHFLLNCLKNLYSMVEQNRKEELKAMIISISNHLRYVFHGSISLIRLKEEIQEVNDYRRTIQSGYLYPIMLFFDVPDELENCLVPPFILQTFIENAVKYSNKTSSETLAIRIQISRALYQDEEYLQIHVSDNGVGYAPEVLEKINSPLTGYFDEQNIGINNLKRRISIIFQGNYHAAFYNLPSKGACSIIFIPLVRRGQESHEAVSG